MRLYSVEIFTPDFQLVGNTAVDSVSYKEDYLSADKNTVTIFTKAGVAKQDYIRISGNGEEYAGIITEISYGTDQSKQLQTITYKPFLELLDTKVLFDVNSQGVGSIEDYIAAQIRATFIENTDALQNVPGLSVQATSCTNDWYLHITPSESGGHYNVVNLLDSVVIPAMEKYSVMVKTRLDVAERAVIMTVGTIPANVLIIESDLPNVIKKNVVLRQTSSDVNKLVLYDASDYTTTVTYYLHSDLTYDRRDQDRLSPVNCDVRAISPDESSTFDSLAIREALSVFGNLAYSNLIELTMLKGDGLVNPEKLEFGQVVDVISDGAAYRSVLTGREIGSHVKLVFGTVRLDLTKLLRRG